MILFLKISICTVIYIAILVGVSELLIIVRRLGLSNRKKYTYYFLAIIVIFLASFTFNSVVAGR